MRRSLLAVVCLAASALILLEAQVRPIYDMGAAGMTQILQRLQTTASVLHTGAHPDDEDSAFIARAARGDHARVAYVSLNRGEGGQNIIGTELVDALGVIRTEELLQARRLDGAEQFFGHTFDYGFSKSRAEAAMKWGERDTLGDYVRVIRMFRPLVIYSRFSGTPADGHGHHQEAGYLTPLAYKAAADPNEFPEQLREGLRPWQAKKLYRGNFGNPRPDPANPSVQVQEGMIDPAAGRSYAEISFEGRSQHKTQAQGGIEPRGPIASTLTLVDFVGADLKVGPYREQSIFDGIDTTVPGLARLAGLPEGAIRAELAAMDAAAKKALADYEALEPARIIPALVDGLRATRAARAAVKSAGGTADARAEADFLLAFKETEFTDALARAAEVDVDPLASQETVVQGETVDVLVRTFVPAGSTVAIQKATVNVPAGWRIEPVPADTGAPNAGGFGRRETPTNVVSYRLHVPADAPVTEPYYLKQRRTGDTYRWMDGDPKSLPFGPPLVTASVALTIGGIDVTVSRPVQFRYADAVRGELRRDVNIVPRVAVGLDTPLLVVPLGSTANQQKLVVRATSFSPRPVTGMLRLRLPQGWTSMPAQASFTLNASGDKTSTPFVVTVPARPSAGRLEIGVDAVVADGATFSRDVQVIAYPHIQTHRLYWPAAATAQVFDLKVAPVKVGYIMGSGDQVPDAIRRMGVDVTMLDGDTLATGDLSKFDTIVVGIRASEANPDFVANNGRLLDYMQRGGTMIVQYQQQEYANRMLPPYPASPPTNANPRVTVEDAPVKILVPAHPAFNFPNKITDADFAGWVQERNAYAFSMFDSRYVPLLETADPGEPPVRGAEVYADIGKGRYVYTAYSWFRQLPAGVPGAYRQFANLISLSKAPR